MKTRTVETCASTAPAPPRRAAAATAAPLPPDEACDDDIPSPIDEDEAEREDDCLGALAAMKLVVDFENGTDAHAWALSWYLMPPVKCGLDGDKVRPADDKALLQHEKILQLLWTKRASLVVVEVRTLAWDKEVAHKDTLGFYATNDALAESVFGGVGQVLKESGTIGIAAASAVAKARPNGDFERGFSLTAARGGAFYGLERNMIISLVEWARRDVEDSRKRSARSWSRP
ncbi:hypothetical protein M885DRAFT_616298 [Pelagophyceae sp. CCMP2097]|nr:hypothetical protein M885DRAFT_616298 [Pelagophyceae sp. CCMP2097]